MDELRQPKRLSEKELSDQKITSLLVDTADPKELESHLANLTQSSSNRRKFLQLAPLILASCASASRHRHREGDNTGQKAALTVEGEKKLTNEVLPKMKKDYPPLKDAKMQNYISQLGQKIVSANQLNKKPYRYQFSMVDVPQINAFALPAGTVFVTVPLLAAAETEAELAGVVGHEIGHVQARHTAERMYAAQKEEKKSLWYSLGGGLLGGVAGFALGKWICPPSDRSCITRASGMGLAAGASGALLIQKYYFMANSREDEMEADRIGFRTAYRSGFHKSYIGNFYKKLLEMEKERKKGNAIMAAFADAMSTHPPSDERVAQMNQMQREVSLMRNSRVSSKAFVEMRKRARSIVKNYQKA